MKLQLENPGSSRDLGSLPEATMGDDDSSESVVPTTRGVAPPPARQEDLKVLRTGLVVGRPVREELRPMGARLREVVRRIGTQMDATRLAQVSVQQLRRYVSGRDPVPVSVVTNLAAASGYSLEWILTGEGQPLASGQASSESEDFGRRLRIACDRVGTQGDAAYAIGLSLAQLKNYITGKSEPSLKPIVALARAAEVNLLWLATGEGPMNGATDPAMTGQAERDTVQSEPEALEIARLRREAYVALNALELARVALSRAIKKA